MREEGYSSGSIFLSFLLGGFVGAGLAVLLAPQSGRETRQKIRDLAEDAKVKATGYVQQTKDKVSTLVDEGKDYYEGKKSVLKSAIDAGKDAYEKEKEKTSKGQNA